jgi:fructokinase
VAADCKVVHAGTLGLVLQPLADATRAVVAASPDDRIVMIDPNCRPSVMTTSEVFRSTLDSVLGRADIVKVSGDDLEFMFPGVDLVEAARALQSRSGAVVLFTDGAKAVRVMNGADEIVLDVPKVHVVDTVGAGDSFSGGFLAQWMQRGLTRNDVRDTDKVVSAALYGIAVAGVTCQRPGADPPRAGEVKGY